MAPPIFDWNRESLDAAKHPASETSTRSARPARLAAAPPVSLRRVQVVDETLRDGMQNATGVATPIAAKIDLLHAMVRVGVDVVSVGLPAAGARYAEDTDHLCREIREARLPLIPTAAARTVVSDVEGIVRASDRAGLPLEVYAFVGSSPIRHAVEGWDTEFLVNAVSSATRAAVKGGLRFCLVTEDTTRSHPDALRTLFRAAVDEGASRLCLCDTTGHVTPYGVEELIGFTRRELAAMGAPGVQLDWHGHNDRGLALPTALWAVEAGIERVHGTGLGVGERVGNASLELLVHNLGLLGVRPRVSRDSLRAYSELSARALAWTIPLDHPLAGERLLREQREPPAYRAAGSSGDAAGTTRAAPADRLVPLTLRIGGQPVELAVRARRTLLEALRYDLDLYGTKQGCDKGDCGACTVVLAGRAVRSCLTLALDADGCDVETVETLGGASHLDPMVACFDQVGGGQCGFCTPGMLMSATALLQRNPRPTREEIQVAISGNLCRCTGYGRIVDAVEMTARIKRGEAAMGLRPNPGLKLPPLPTARRGRAPSPGLEHPPRQGPAQGGELSHGREARPPAGHHAHPRLRPRRPPQPRGPRPARHRAGPLHRRHPPPAHALGPPPALPAPARAHRPHRPFPRAGPARRPRGHHGAGHARAVRHHPPGPRTSSPSPSSALRFVGDAVAAVAATDERLAHEAAEFIDVEYEILPAATDLDTAITHPEIGLSRDGKDNVSKEVELEFGDVDVAPRRLHHRGLGRVLLRGLGARAHRDPLRHRPASTPTASSPCGRPRMVSSTTCTASCSGSVLRVSPARIRVDPSSLVGGGFGGRRASRSRWSSAPPSWPW